MFGSQCTETDHLFNNSDFLQSIFSQIRLGEPAEHRIEYKIRMSEISYFSTFYYYYVNFNIISQRLDSLGI